MKYLLSILIAMSFASFTNAQDCSLKRADLPKKCEVNPVKKSAGVIIWQEDFNKDKWISTVKSDGEGYVYDSQSSLPANWVFFDGTNNGVSNSGYGYFHWSDVGPRGAYTATRPTFPEDELLEYLPDGTSDDNGFLMLESDWANTNPETGEEVSNIIDLDAYIQYGPIDFSAYKGAIFSLNTFYRYCCNSAESQLTLELSSDYNPSTNTGTWQKYVINENTGANNFPVPSERKFVLNVSNDVKGKSSVYFRIREVKSSHYFWIIDDIKFEDVPVNDIMITDGFADYIYDATDPVYTISSDNTFNFWGGYTEIPQKVVGEFPQFRAAVLANGSDTAYSATATVEMAKDGKLVMTKTSRKKDINPYVYDTLYIFTDFSPTDAGHYQVTMTVNIENDEVDNNSWYYNFDITDAEDYSRVRHGKEDEYDRVSPADFVDGGSSVSWDRMVNQFNFPPEVSFIRVRGVRVYIDNYSGMPSELTAIQNGEFSMVAKLYYINESGEIAETGLSSNQRVLTPADVGTWVFMPFTTGETTLTTGTYYAGIEVYTGDKNLRFMIGADAGAGKQPMGGGLCYLSSIGKWTLHNANYAIDFVINKWPLSVEENKKSTCNIYPNPFSNELSIESTKQIQSVTITNIIGQIVKNITVNSPVVSINTSDLNKGVYIVSVKYKDNSVQTQKIVKH